MSYPSTINHIANSEKVNAATIGRVTQALDRRTNYLKDRVDTLFERVSRLQIDNVVCGSAVKPYTAVYFDGTSYQPAYIDLGNATGIKGRALGVATNIKTLNGQRVCDVVLKGLVEVPSQYTTNLISDGGGFTDATIYFLTTALASAGKLTSNSNQTTFPILYSLATTTSGDRLVIIDPDTLYDPNHRHVMDEWELTSANHTLSFTPLNTASVIIAVNGIIQRQGTVGVSSWTSEGDPDYEISGNQVTFYEHNRYRINSDPLATGNPKVTAWYLAPFGDFQNVEALIQGNNIAFSTCTVDADGLASGVVTISSYFNPWITTHTDCGDTCVRSLEYLAAGGNDAVTGAAIGPQRTVAHVGPNVCKIVAGSNITLQSTGSAAGTGEVTINASPVTDTFDLLAPDQIVLLAAQESLVNGIFPVIDIDAGYEEERALAAKFIVPRNADPNIKLQLRFGFFPVTGVAGTMKLKVAVYSIAPGDSIDEFSETYTAEIAIPSVQKDNKVLVDYELGDKFNGSNVKINSAVPVEREATLVVHLWRDSTDAYAESFRLDSLQLRYKRLVL